MEALFRAHWGRAHRAAFLIVHDAAAAEDIAQEAFLAAIRALHRFDRRRPFGPWLHRIVVNRAIDWSRACHLRREVTLMQRIHDSGALLKLLQTEIPPEYRRPGTWMHDALELRDEWTSRLLRTSSWSPLH